MGEPGTRCKNPSVATHPLSFGRVPKNPVSHRVDCSGLPWHVPAEERWREFPNCDPSQAEDGCPRPAGHLACSHANTRKAAFQFRLGSYGWFLLLSFISSVCPKLYSYENNRRSRKPRRRILRSEVSLCCCMVGYVWYHKVFIIQAKSDRLTILCTVKQKGNHSSIKIRKQRLNNIILTIQSHCPPRATTPVTCSIANCETL